MTVCYEAIADLASDNPKDRKVSGAHIGGLEKRTISQLLYKYAIEEDLSCRFGRKPRPSAQPSGHFRRRHPGQNDRSFPRQSSRIAVHVVVAGVGHHGGELGGLLRS